MADLFRSFLDFRPLYSSYKLHAVLPSKHLASTHVYSPRSRIHRIHRSLFHLTLFSRPSALTPSSVDVISTHEHSDGSLVFRFGEPGEAASSVQLEGPNVEKKENEKEVIESIDYDLVVSVLNSDNDRDVEDSSLAEVTDEANSIFIGSKNINIGENKNDLDENLTEGTEFELPSTISHVDLKDFSTQGICTGKNEEYLNDEQENSSMKSVSPNFDLISTHEHSDGSLIFRFGDLSEAASNAQLEESKVEKEGTEEGRMMTDLNGDDDGSVRDSNLAEVTDESTSIDIDGKKLIVSEKENDLDEKSKDTNEFELPTIVSEVELKIASTSGSDIENDGKDEEWLNEEVDSSSLMTVSMLANSSEMENSIAAVEPPENNIVDVAMLQTIPLSPDTLTESEKDAFQASIDTVVSTELFSDSKIDGDVNKNVTVASGMEAELQLSVDSEVQISSEGYELRNEIADDGSESGIIQLMPMPPQLETGSEFTDNSNSILIDGKNLNISEKENDLGEKLKDNNEFELPTIVSEGELKNSSALGNDIENDGKDEECLNEEVDSSSLMSVSMLANNIEDSIAAVETPEENIIDVTRLQTIYLSPYTLIKSEEDAIQASTDTVVSTELSLDSKIDGDVDKIVTVAPGMEASLQLSIDTEAQTSLGGNELRNEIAEDGNESGIQLMSMSPQLETGQAIDEESVTLDGEEYRDTNEAKSLKLLDDIPQKPILVSESTDDDDNVNGDIVESSGNQVMEVELTEVPIKSPEIQLKDLVLSSGAALFPHPSKVLTGGEDAYFVTGRTWLGVADGVGQWSFEGTNPGVYAQELIKNCEKLVLDCDSNSICDPAELLKLSVGETHSPGSSTVLLAQLVGQVLQVANIGDSGFIILRNGFVYKRSSPMLHVFHFPIQIERGGDPSNLAEFYRIDLEEQDVIILASDGLLDNLYDQEIASEVSKYLAVDSKPEEIAEALAAKAQKVGKSASARTPFADSAQAAGYAGYAGGKLDDITVIVSMVQRQSSFQAL